MIGARSRRYIRCNEIVTRKPQHGARASPLVNIVTPFRDYRYVGYTHPPTRERGRGQAPIVSLKSCNDVNERESPTAVMRLSRYTTDVTSVTSADLVNKQGGCAW